jgi:putative hydrolases of HD superfamily
MQRMENHLRKSLQFVQHAERLKTVLRSGHASNGRPESTAEHTWRLCLLAMVFERDLPGVDFAKLLKICVIHDLGEAISGDIPATQQNPLENKAAQERADLLQLLAPLSSERQADFLALWDEYNAAQTPEAKLAKGLDKIETIIQHNQGQNPPDFDYAFNLGYGQKHTAMHPLLQALRQMVDADTEQHARRQGQQSSVQQ